MYKATYDLGQNMFGAFRPTFQNLKMIKHQTNKIGLKQFLLRTYVVQLKN